MARALTILAAIAIVAAPRVALAQRSSVDSTRAAHQMPMMNHDMPMSSGLLDVSMRRMGSGTTWVPEAMPLPSRHFTAGAWSLMAHGSAFAQYNAQAGPRGDRQFAALNWGMVMASRALAGGRFEARTMLSVDALTVGGAGYPLLLQSGEVYQGAPIHDRQHPHDLWMELAALYEHSLTSSVAASIYAAPAGEPALGPVAFMHRPSAMDNPLAPISHHWQDATHVSFGVLTAGVFGERWKLEGSAFNAREPDEHRWNFDLARLDSYSARATINPNAQWSLSTGYGYLRDPEVAHPGEPVHRLTASALRSGTSGANGQWSTTAVWGANIAHGAWTHSALVEGEAVLDDQHTVFARVERVQKSAEELVLDPLMFDPERLFTVGAATLGGIRELVGRAAVTVGLGAAATVSVVPPALQGTYGSRTPFSGVVFLRLRVRNAGMAMDHSHGSMGAAGAIGVTSPNRTP